MEHQHTPPIFSANNKLVCKECIKKEDKGFNECFHLCHQKGLERCNGCAVYHQK